MSHYLGMSFTIAVPVYLWLAHPAVNFALLSCAEYCIPMQSEVMGLGGDLKQTLDPCAWFLTGFEDSEAVARGLASFILKTHLVG